MSQLETRLASSNDKLNSFLDSIMTKIDFVLHLQTLIFVHFQDFSALTFYTSITVVVWVLTSFKCMSGSRLSCLILSLGSFLIEKVILLFIQAPLYPQSTNSLLSFSRFTVALVLAIFLIYQRVSYVNVNFESNLLIKKVIRESIEQTPAWFRKYKAHQPEASLDLSSRQLFVPLTKQKFQDTTSETSSQASTKQDSILSRHDILRSKAKVSDLSKDIIVYQTPLLKAKHQARIFHSA